VLETRVDGSPDAIEDVGIFLSNTVAAHAQVLSTDIASARARMLDGWTGAAADAFGSTTLTAKRSVDAYGEEVAGLAGAVKKLGFVLAEVQATMSDARRTAAGAGLTVSGTQIRTRSATRMIAGRRRYGPSPPSGMLPQETSSASRRAWSRPACQRLRCRTRHTG
jgi:uncharacterized protein YukE